MKALKFFAFTMLIFAISTLVFSCGNSGYDQNGHSNDGTHTGTVHGEGKAYTSAYVCPMHCEGSGSDQAGKCPACGMDYVAQSEHTKDGHKH